MLINKHPLTFATPAFADESLTSWLIRASLRHGMNPMDFTTYYWGTKDRLWTKDLDYYYPTNEMMTDIDILSHHQSPLTLGQIFGLYPKNPMNNASKSTLILPLTKRNRTAKYGQVYCPLCFADDKNAHLSLSWRLAPMVICPIHCCQLQDKCHNCHSIYQPHLLTYDSPFINRCPNCLTLLTNSVELLSLGDCEFQKLLEFQKDLTKSVFEQTSIQVFGQSLKPSDYLDLVAYLITLIRYAFRTKGENLALLFQKLGVPMQYFEPYPVKGLVFGSMTNAERLPIIIILAHLLKTNSEQWLLASIDSKISRATLLFAKNIVLPSILTPVYSGLADNFKSFRKKPSQQKSKSYTQVKNRYALLKRKAFGVNND